MNFFGGYDHLQNVQATSFIGDLLLQNFLYEILFVLKL